MTKGELIRFLEPFSDDLKIVIDQGFDGLRFPEPKYAISRGEKPTLEGAVDIEDGEGFVTL